MAVVGLDPTSGPIRAAGDKPLATRPESLDGQVVGLVANGLGLSETLLAAIYEELARDADLRGAISVVKSSVSIPADPGDWARLTAGATVAITAFGG
jgi:hypothetical protein